GSSWCVVALLGVLFVALWRCCVVALLRCCVVALLRCCVDGWWRNFGLGARYPEGRVGVYAHVGCRAMSDYAALIRPTVGACILSRAANSGVSDYAVLIRPTGWVHAYCCERQIQGCRIRVR